LIKPAGLPAATFGACAAILVIACRDGDPRPPHATPAAATATAIPPEGVSISPPRSADQPLTDEAFHRGERIFIADRVDGTIQALGAGLVWSSNDPIEWVDDDTLIAQLPDRFVEIDLDGAVRQVAATRPPGNERLLSIGGDSASGRWSLGWLSSAPGGLLVSERARGGEWLYRITNVPVARWSPTADLLMLTGNHCQGVDLFTFDPSTATLVNVTPDDDRSYLDAFVWLPDGAGVAAAAQFGGDAPGAAMALVDAAGGGTITLAQAEGPFATMRPLEWSPSGRRLVFVAGIGGPIPCSGNGEETVVEVGPPQGGPP